MSFGQGPAAIHPDPLHTRRNQPRPRGALGGANHLLMESSLHSGARWIASDEELAAAAQGWRGASLLAVDTEFVRERTFRPILGLIQIADENGVTLIDPQKAREPRPAGRAAGPARPRQGLPLLQRRPRGLPRSPGADRQPDLRHPAGRRLRRLRVFARLLAADRPALRRPPAQNRNPFGLAPPAPVGGAARIRGARRRPPAGGLPPAAPRARREGPARDLPRRLRPDRRGSGPAGGPRSALPQDRGLAPVVAPRAGPALRAGALARRRGQEAGPRRAASCCPRRRCRCWCSSSRPPWRSCPRSRCSRRGSRQAGSPPARADRPRAPGAAGRAARALPRPLDVQPFKKTLQSLRTALEKVAADENLPAELLANRRSLEALIRRYLQQDEQLLPRKLRGWREQLLRPRSWRCSKATSRRAGCRAPELVRGGRRDRRRRLSRPARRFAPARGRFSRRRRPRPS